MNAIIKRAAALQMESSPEKSAGATIEQIQEAAAELGISPEMVERAADDILASQNQPGFSLLGSPRKAEFSRAATGVILEQDLPSLLKEIRRITGRVGNPRTVGNSLEWQSNQPDILHVTLTPRNGKTLIDVQSDFSNWIGVAFALPLSLSLALGFGLLGELGPEVGGILLIVLQLIVFFANRSVFAWITRTKRNKARELASQLAEYVETQATQTQNQVVVVDAPTTTKIHQTLIG